MSTAKKTKYSPTNKTVHDQTINNPMMNNSTGYNITRDQQMDRDSSSYVPQQLVENNGKDECYRYIGKMMSCLCCFPEVHVPDDHVGIVIEFGRFSKVLPVGTHSYNIFTEYVQLLEFVTVPEYNKGVLLRDKKIIKILEEGKHWYNPALNEEIQVVPLTIINENTIGIVTRNGVYSHILESGLHFINKYNFEGVKIVSATVITEKQKGIRINRGKFEEILEPGQYYENPVLDIKIIAKDTTIIDEGHVGLKCIDGKLIATLEPGMYFENDYKNEKIIDVNLQILTKELKPQEIISKDTVSMIIHSILVYQIIDPYKARCLVDDVDFSIREAIKTATHQVLSENELDRIMDNKKQLSEVIKERVELCCCDYGVKIDRIDIKDVKISEELKEALTASAIARRMAESKYINAEAEVRSAKLMRETADLLATEAAMNIRNQETIQNICKNQNTKVYFFADPSMMNVTKDKISKELIKRNEQINESLF
jgi:regulator of protease activity HflC (stomatin/prohibitin superfamily)